VGDFDGNGRPEVTVAYDSIDDSRGRLNIYQLDPQTLALELKQSHTFSEHSTAIVTTLAAGRFGSTLHDHLLLGYYIIGQPAAFKSFDFDGSLTPILKDTFTTTAVNIQELNFGTGRFDPTSPFNQVAVKLNQGRDNVRLGIISLDNDLKIRLPNFTRLPGIACSSGGLPRATREACRGMHNARSTGLENHM
jgi:hypothetical protein